MTLNLDSLLQCAVDAARAAGGHALGNFHRRREITERFAHDVKLVLDAECQGVAEAVIRSAFPGHGIIGEESRDGSKTRMPGLSFEPNGTAIETKSPTQVEWIIDPIDGTVNFMHGHACWCSSVAVAVDSRIVAGAVYAPALDDCYSAKSGAQSLLNGKPISVSNVSSLTEAMVFTGADRNIAPSCPPLAFFQVISEAAAKTRIMGSAALDLCRVASGTGEAYFEAGIYVWDIAAAGLINQQAGGTCELLREIPPNRLCFLASNGLVHAELGALVAQCLQSHGLS